MDDFDDQRYSWDLWDSQPEDVCNVFMAFGFFGKPFDMIGSPVDGLCLQSGPDGTILTLRLVG